MHRLHSRIVASFSMRFSSVAGSALALAIAATAGAAGKPAAPAAPARPATPPANTRPAAPPAAPPAAKPATPPAGGAAAAEAAAMEAWSKYMTPGPEHARLLKQVGEWDLDVTQIPMPGAPPVTSKATAKIEPALGGRYIIERVRGTFMEMPFEGIGTNGFDNVLKKAVFTWIDNMGTGIMTGTGTMSADGKTMNGSGKMVDPMAGKEVPYRMVVTYIDDNTHKAEMFNAGPDGKEFKSMELLYKRKGAAPATTPAAPPAGARPPAAPTTPAAPSAPTAPAKPAERK